MIPLLLSVMALHQQAHILQVIHYIPTRLDDVYREIGAYPGSARVSMVSEGFEQRWFRHKARKRSSRHGRQYPVVTIHVAHLANAMRVSDQSEVQLASITHLRTILIARGAQGQYVRADSLPRVKNARNTRIHSWTCREAAVEH